MHNKYHLKLKALILIKTVLIFQNDTRNVTSKLQALNCLITWSIGALQMGQGSPLNFNTCAHCKQQQQCPVSPWMIVAFLGCSIQIMHFELSSVSSGKAKAFPLSVISAIQVAFDSDSAVVTRSRVTHGFSSGWRLERAEWVWNPLVLPMRAGEGPVWSAASITPPMQSWHKSYSHSGQCQEKWSTGLLWTEPQLSHLHPPLNWAYTSCELAL